MTEWRVLHHKRELFMSFTATTRTSMPVFDLKAVLPPRYHLGISIRVALPSYFVAPNSLSAALITYGSAGIGIGSINETATTNIDDQTRVW